MRRVVPLIAALALLTGCSQTTVGSPAPGGSGSTSTEAPESSAAEEPATRPKAIDIADLDPCGVLTEPQRAEFGLDRPPQPGGQPGKKGCTMSREDRKYFVGVTADTTAGLDSYAESKGKVTSLEVGGFPALLIEATTELGLSCSVTVDVADGQALDVQASSLGDTDVPTLCQIIQPVAGAVMANLNK